MKHLILIVPMLFSLAAVADNDSVGGLFRKDESVPKTGEYKLPSIEYLITVNGPHNFEVHPIVNVIINSKGYVTAYEVRNSQGNIATIAKPEDWQNQQRVFSEDRLIKAVEKSPSQTKFNMNWPSFLKTLGDAQLNFDLKPVKKLVAALKLRQPDSSEMFNQLGGRTIEELALANAAQLSTPDYSVWAKRTRKKIALMPKPEVGTDRSLSVDPDQIKPGMMPEPQLGPDPSLNVKEIVKEVLKDEIRTAK
jgi:hypothetical protein